MDSIQRAEESCPVKIYLCKSLSLVVLHANLVILFFLDIKKEFVPIKLRENGYFRRKASLFR